MTSYFVVGFRASATVDKYLYLRSKHRVDAYFNGEEQRMIGRLTAND
jgi:hypothetical protein